MTKQVKSAVVAESADTTIKEVRGWFRFAKSVITFLADLARSFKP